MEFGIFSQMHCPPWDDEHSRFLREIEVVASCATPSASSTTGRPSTTSSSTTRTSRRPRSSSPASRRAPSGSTSAPRSPTSPRAVNHPARVAERIATLDHLSEGRVEFGTGRGSSSAEWARLRHPVGRRDQADVARVARADPAHVARRAVRVRGQVLPDARAQRAAEAVLEAAPADVGGVLEPADVRRGRRARPRRALLHLRHADRDRAARQELQGRRSSAARSRSAATSTTTSPSRPTCSASTDGDEARASLLARRRSGTFTELFFNWLDSIPRPKGLPPTGPVPPLPDPTPEQLKAGLAGRRPPDRLARGDRPGHRACTRSSASIS